MFKQENGDWTKYRELHPYEVDFHYSGSSRDDEGPLPPGTRRRRRKYDEPPPMPYWAMMDTVWLTALSALRDAQAVGQRYVLFLHGSSTSGADKNTARSQVRSMMESQDAVPYIIPEECVQHET